MRHLSLVFLLLAVFVLTACGSSPAPRAPRPTPERSATAKEIRNAANAARTVGATCGTTYFAAVAPLKLDNHLVQAAIGHSEDMQSTGVMSHTGSDGSSAGQRISRTGYQWSTWGENVAAGFSSSASVAAAWLASPGHCQNIMNPNFTELGAARSGNFWTMVFARPR